MLLLLLLQRLCQHFLYKNQKGNWRAIKCLQVGEREAGRLVQSGTFLLAQLCTLAQLKVTDTSDFIKAPISDFTNLIKILSI